MWKIPFISQNDSHLWLSVYHQEQLEDIHVDTPCHLLTSNNGYPTVSSHFYEHWCFLLPYGHTVPIDKCKLQRHSEWLEHQWHLVIGKAEPNWFSCAALRVTIPKRPNDIILFIANQDLFRKDDKAWLALPNSFTLTKSQAATDTLGGRWDGKLDCFGPHRNRILKYRKVVEVSFNMLKSSFLIN